MPVHVFKCKNCDRKVDVLRNLHDSDVEPTPDEIRLSGPEVKPCIGHEWRKYFESGTTFLPGPNWGGWQKGKW